MGGIFISYRSGPHAVTVGALAHLLEHYFGANRVFIDHQMEPGTEYPDQLKMRLLGSDVVLAVIHDDWLADLDRPRPKDWVRYEIATALAKGTTVVPVLLEQADPKQLQQLPDDIAGLGRLQVAPVRGATFPKDVAHLSRVLEQYVLPGDTPPAEQAEAAKPKRVGRRIIAWAAALFLLSPILFFFDDARQGWEWLAFSAFTSSALLAVISLLNMIFVPMVKRLTYRWDVEAGTITLREATKRRWLLLALGMIPFVYMLSKFGTMQDGVWQEWEVWFLVVVGVVSLFLMHRTWRRQDARDYTWPPPVSTEPAVFRRAAFRLHEKLTTDWRGPRSRTSQREAVAVYLNLAEVRLKLRTRATEPLIRWIGHGYTDDTAGYLGWLASIVALDIVALVMALAQSVAAGAYWLIAVTVAVAVVFAAAKTLTDFYSDRRDARRWIDELTDWQTKLGPLVFC